MVRRIVPTCLSADGASPQPKMDFYRKEIDTYSDTPHYGQEIGIQLTSTDQRDASDQPLGTSWRNMKNIFSFNPHYCCLTKTQLWGQPCDECSSLEDFYKVGLHHTVTVLWRWCSHIFHHPRSPSLATVAEKSNRIRHQGRINWFQTRTNWLLSAYHLVAVQSRARAESLYLQCFWCKKNWRTTTWSFCFSTSGTWFRTMPTRLTSCMILRSGWFLSQLDGKSSRCFTKFWRPAHPTPHFCQAAPRKSCSWMFMVWYCPFCLPCEAIAWVWPCLTRSPTDGIPALPTGSHCCGLSWGSDAARVFCVLERGRTMSFYVFWGRVIAVVERIEQCRAQASQTILSCYIIFMCT